MTPIAPLITAFLREHMPRQRGYSAHSSESYAICLRLLLTFAADRLKTRPSRLALEEIDAAMVLAFLAHIEQDRGNSPATRNVRLAEAPSFGRPVLLHDKYSRGALAYLALAGEVNRRSGAPLPRQ